MNADSLLVVELVAHPEVVPVQLLQRGNPAPDHLLVVVHIGHWVVSQVERLEHLECAQVFAVGLALLKLVPVQPELLQSFR